MPENKVSSMQSTWSLWLESCLLLQSNAVVNKDGFIRFELQLFFQFQYRTCQHNCCCCQSPHAFRSLRGLCSGQLARLYTQPQETDLSQRWHAALYTRKKVGHAFLLDNWITSFHVLKKLEDVKRCWACRIHFQLLGLTGVTHTIFSIFLPLSSLGPL